MTWATTKEACRLAIAAALKLQDYTGASGVVGSVHKVEWSNKASATRYLTSGSAWADLHFHGVTAEGTDEIRYETIVGATPALTRVVPTYCGRRTFYVSVQVGVDDQEDDVNAMTLAGLLRTRLRRNEILAILHDAEVGLVSIGPAMDADYRDADGRMVSNVIVEIKFACIESDTDSTESGDYIATAAGDGEAGLAGSTFTAQ